MAGFGMRDESESKEMSGNSSNPTPSRGKRIVLKTIEDAQRELARVYRDMRNGRIATADGSRLAYVLVQFSDLIERGEIEGRLRELERRVRDSRMQEPRHWQQ